MDLSLHNLVIEVTRRCNASCDHCCRGDVQNMDMPMEHVEALFKRITWVGSIALTGGEPSLVPEIIVNIVEMAKRQGVGFGGFYIATNAVSVTPEFLAAVALLYGYCDDNEISALEWSNDDYHDIPESNIKLLEAFRFARAKFNRKYYDRSNLMIQGRAEEFGTREITKEEFEYYHYDGCDETQVSEGNLYLNCKGNLIGGCDWSFENQDDPENIICAADELSFQKLVDFGAKDAS